MRLLLAIALTLSTALAADKEEEEYHKAPVGKVLAHQYRHGADIIPAASAREKRLAEFSPDAAKEYVEGGPTLWSKQQDCFSCHTHGIYAFTRPAMTPHWGPPPDYLRPFLVEKSRELRAKKELTGTEPTKLAYLARALVAWDAEFSKTTSAESDAALRFIFKNLQDDKTGRIASRNNWPPLNATAYHGTIATAMALADAPAWRDSLDPEKDKELVGKIKKLESFLRDTPPLNDHERLLLLWASTRTPGLLSFKSRATILGMLTRQQRPDGGWSIRTFATTDTWGSPRKAEELRTEPESHKPSSDGYQTGLTLLVLADAGIPANDPRVKDGIQWLKTNQRKTGRWWTKSLNLKSRFHFITYSGTAYATLALSRYNALSLSD